MKYWAIGSREGTNRFSLLRYELVCVTEERPALRVAQDYPLDADVFELDGAATLIQPITLGLGKAKEHT